MSDDRDWFVPKRYGWGAVPISWQGWAVTIAFVIIASASVKAFRSKPLLIFAVMVPVTLVFMVICARTTKGGWRWRWGEDE